jgi:hypothetical protein
MILAIRGDKGIHFINGPPEYNQFDGFAPDAAKNCKVSFVLLLLCFPKVNKVYYSIFYVFH